MWRDLLQEAWGVESCDSRGGQVDGQAAVVAEALEAAEFPFLLSELAVCSDAWIGSTGVGVSDDAVELLPDFAGAEEEADCLFQPEDAVSHLTFQ